MSLWWLQPGWTSAKCSCGATVWPQGDPDWGACYRCFSASLAESEQLQDENEYYAGMEEAESREMEAREALAMIKPLIRQQMEAGND